LIANVLSIAGSDPSGGAGIQADIKAMSAMGAYAMAVVTAATAQNTRGVRSFVALEPGFVGEQIDAVFDDVRVDAVKIGMVANARIAAAIAERLRWYKPASVVLDPVMVAKSGNHLLEQDAVSAVRELLVPCATIVTPNLPEAAVLLGASPSWTVAEMRNRVAGLRALGSAWVLLKGGHLDGSAASIDILHGATDTIELSSPRIDTPNTHGTGCTLSAAIAALLPRLPVQDSVRRAKTYVQAALAASGELDVGGGHGPLHHFHELWATPPREPSAG
jgi:hydroxymethylpyrimidine/phosphomethylpyrimidine kinase